MSTIGKNACYTPSVKYLDGLNSEQKKAAMHTTGPLLILAGAGAGKTKTITHRIAHLIASGVPGDAILAVTFTNKAAGEMKERVANLLKDLPPSQGYPTVATFHALCVRILREHAAHLQLPRSFTIWDRDDQMKAVKEALKALDIGDQYEPRTILSRISRSKGDSYTQEDFARTANNPFTDIVAKVWLRYEEALRRDHAVDFDDLLLKTMLLLQGNTQVRERLQARWTHIIIDEYQDTNKVQFEIARLLVGERHNICVVGDVDQNIYSWRGADIQHLLSFERVFPGATVIMLEQNYRSTQTILAAANDVIKKNQNRYEKNLFTENAEGESIALYSGWSEQEEARHIAQTASALIIDGTAASEIAVLYRANFQSRALEQAFLEQGVPHRVLGTRFFERKEVKDILSYLRAAMNPESRADIARIIASPPRGIGKGTLTYMLEGTLSELPSGARKKVEGFYQLLQDINTTAQQRPVSDVVKFIIEKSGLGLHHSKGTEEDIERLGNMKELASLATKYDTLPAPQGAEQLLEDAALLGEQDNVNKSIDAVSLMTVHASKGLEFDMVFISGLEEGLFPMERKGETEDSEEERRLFYVALTRARKKVLLSYAGTRMVYGSRDISTPSQFLGDISPEHIAHVAPSLLEQWGGEDVIR